MLVKRTKEALLTILWIRITNRTREAINSSNKIQIQTLEHSTVHRTFKFKQTKEIVALILLQVAKWEQYKCQNEEIVQFNKRPNRLLVQIDQDVLSDNLNL